MKKSVRSKTAANKEVAGYDKKLSDVLDLGTWNRLYSLSQDCELGPEQFLSRLIDETYHAFPYGDGAGSDDQWNKLCEKHKWEPIELFQSWNEEQGSVGLALTDNGVILARDAEFDDYGILSLAESLRFYARMQYESKESDITRYGKQQWLERVADALEQKGA